VVLTPAPPGRSPLRAVLAVTAVGTVVVLLLLLAAAAWLGLRGMTAARELQAARDELTAVRADLDGLDDLDAVRAAVDRAGRSTERARGVTGDMVWRAAATVPVAGSSVRSFRGIVTAVDDLARRALPDALAAGERLQPARLLLPDGSVDLAALRAAGADLDAGADQVAQVRARLALLPTSGVPSALEQARRELLGQVEQADDVLQGATRTVRLLPPLLGEDRPRRYFVMVQQTAEARGTGGLPGGFAVVETHQGRYEVAALGSNEDLEQGDVPVPAGVPQDYVDTYRPLGAFSIWQNVNLSPDLPVVARVVGARWRQQGGGALDGVVTVDGPALAMLLEGSEPLPLPGGERLEVEQLPDYLAVGQYAGLPFGGVQSQRKDRLVDVAAAVSGRLTGQGASEQLLRGVVRAVRSGHLRMASDDPALEPGLTAAGVTGALPSGPAPVAYPVVVNTTGGKLEHFLDRRVEYAGGPCSGPRRQTSIAVELRNNAPDGLPPYNLVRWRPGAQVQSVDSAVQLTVYGTPGARLLGATVDGQRLAAGAELERYVVTGQEAGLPAWTMHVELPQGTPRRLELELEEPVVAGAPRVPEQPLSRPLETEVTLPRCG
jgi:hypothetical protein